MSRRRERRRRAAARSRDRMQINVVRHLVVLMIVQVKFHLVALADTNEAARHIAAECQEHILNPIAQALLASSTFHVPVDLAGLFCFDRRRPIRARVEPCRPAAGNVGSACYAMLASAAGHSYGALDLFHVYSKLYAKA